MTEKTNLAASVRQRLLNLSRERQEPFVDTMLRFAAERLLYRLSRSDYSKRFVLKGSLLISLWNGNLPYRPTRDMDLHGIGSNKVANLEAVFRNLAALPLSPPDGLLFQPQSVKGRRINEAKAYSGVRIRLEATLDTAVIPVKVDIAFGDVITPGADTVAYPTLLPEFPAPQIRSYPIYTVLAEKIEAMVSLGDRNGRMKDFFDVHFLTIGNTALHRGQLRTALERTFTRRGTPFPAKTPECLPSAFAKKRQELEQFSG